MTKKAYLVLRSGEIFQGISLGADMEGAGELVFTTDVVGYLENLTDPAYCGQILVQTFPEIGNYGVIPEDLTGKPALAGYVVRALCESPSNFRSKGSLDQYLKENGIPVIAGVDTRQITRLLQKKGTVEAKICFTYPDNIEALFQETQKNPVPAVSTKDTYVLPARGEERFRVTLLDCGVTKDVLDDLTARGCRMTVVPHDTSAEEILVTNPHGVLISGGPGDPMQCISLIHEIKKLIGRRPLFAYGLGHQLVALASGARTCKMENGHRGSQPVREVGGSRTYITKQNHGYRVIGRSLPLGARLSYVNANDRTCEGVDYRGKQCFTVQFTPGQDTAFLYDQFITMMGGRTNAER